MKNVNGEKHKRRLTPKQGEICGVNRSHSDERTDIVFLGRGVSRGLADRRSNIELLQSNSLPVLSSPADLAQAMGISDIAAAMAGVSQRCTDSRALCFV